MTAASSNGLSRSGGLGAGGRALVHGAQALLAHVRVQLSGGQVGVTEQLLHSSHVGTTVEKMSGERVAKGVRGRRGRAAAGEAGGARGGVGGPARGVGRGAGGLRNKASAGVASVTNEARPRASQRVTASTLGSLIGT